MHDFWTQVGATAAVVIPAVGYLARRIGDVEKRLDARIDKLTDLYVRHLETHAGGNR